VSKSILLIDDSATIRSVLKVYLTGKSYQFVDAENAERGLQLLKIMPINLIIVDVNLPGMDGLTFVREVRRHAVQTIQNIPIVVLTAQKAEELREQGLKAGANAFVQKPIFGSSLLDTVNALLGEV
jgi:two-component system chemotaxis response regulator CheY